MHDLLVKKLERAEGPDRRLDTELALIVGYRRDIETDDSVDPPKKRLVFFPPGSAEPVKVPAYTASIDIARTFVDFIHKNAACAVTFSPRGSAVVNNGAQCEAATAPIALCLAALKTPT